MGPTLLRVVRDGWRYRAMMLVTVLATALASASAWLLLALAQRVLTALNQLQPGAEPASVLSELRLAALGLVAGAVPAAAAGYTAWRAGQSLANRCACDLRERFVAHLVRLDLAFHAAQTRGDLLTRITADLDRLYGVQSTLYGRLLQRGAQAVGCAAYVCLVSWQIGLVVFAVLVPSVLVLSNVLGSTRRRSQRAQETLASTLTAFEQITAGIRVIKTMGSTEREVARYGELNDTLFGHRQRVARSRANSEALTQGMVWLLGGATFLLAAFLLARNLLLPSQLITVLGAFGLLLSAVRDANRAWGDVVEAMPSAQRVYAVLDARAHVLDRQGAAPAPPPVRAIAYEGVRFRYETGDQWVLGGIDLRIPVGATVALVGPSGGGKSTLLDLLPRLREVTEGCVTWDGVDVRGLQADSLIQHCAIVSQDPFLFHDSIARNIAYGRPSASTADVIAAARRAHVHDDILALEGGQGYATIVGDRGSRLSGGQRQRIAIARALLRDAPILLLDEPTSALDADSERHVQAALEMLMRGRTTVVVAHRLATVQRADVIYVIAEREVGAGSVVVEAGTHHELVARDGAYAALVRLQQLA